MSSFTTFLSKGELEARSNTAPIRSSSSPVTSWYFHMATHTSCPTGPRRCIVDNGKHLKEVFSQGMAVARDGGGGEPTSFVCGYMECDRELCKTFLGGLPPVFKVNIRNDPAGQWLENSIKFSAGKRARTRRAAMRYWRGCLKRSLWRPCAVTWRSCRRSRRAGSQEREIRGWERRWRTCIALRNIPWTIATLAQEVGVSRSVLAERFRQYLGEPPMTYLSRWRLQLGRGC